MKPRILFVHAVCPSQFSELCEYLNATGLAEAWYMTTPGNAQRNASRYQNLLPFTPDGNIVGQYDYYYSGKVERAGRISLGLYRQLKALGAEEFDLVVAHGSLGSPHFLFDQCTVPIITYIEFPSYADHGWDAAYPPTEPQQLIDKNMQMLSYYQAIKSARTLVPTEYARNMFPDYLKSKIVAQFEGMDPTKIAQRESCGVNLPEGKSTLGFAARDLSSAKGLETFIATAATLIERGEDIHFVVIGDPGATTYGYERIFLDREYGKSSGVNFIDHLMRQYEVDSSRFTLTGKLPYAQYSDLLHQIDLFMYPVKYGSGNWGLVELLMRGRPVIGADRCYVPELIEHNDNGLLVAGDDPDGWADAVVELLSQQNRRKALGARAAERAASFELPRAAENFMALFEQVIDEFRAAAPSTQAE